MLKQIFHVSDEYIVEAALVTAHVYALNSLEKTAEVDGLFRDLKSDEGAEPILQKIQEEFKAVPPWWKIASLDREWLEILWERERLIFDQGLLERKLKELISLLISISNGAKESALHYRDRLKAIGAREDEILEAVMVMENFHRNVKVNDGVQTVPGDLLDPGQQNRFKTSYGH